MKMHHPSHAMADRVSVRTYLLAGVSVLSAGMIAASPAGPPQADHTVALTPLAANSAIVPAAGPAAPDPDPSASSGATSLAAAAPTSLAAAAPTVAEPITAAAPARPGIQLSLLTGSPNLGAGNVGNFNTGVNNTGLANTGVANNGKFNIGAANTGDFNIGVSNQGDFNIGVRNNGNFNVGAFNTGVRNFGIGNNGTLNVGLANTGTANVGIGNDGTGNIGFFNTGDYTIGAFNIGIRYAQRPAADSTSTVSTLSAGSSDERSASSTVGSPRRVSTKDGNKTEPAGVAGAPNAQPTRKPTPKRRPMAAAQAGATPGAVTRRSASASMSGNADDRGASTDNGRGGS